jgi:hypothetical protein
MTHFGAAEDVDEHLAEVGDRLDRWAGLARSGDQEAFMAAIRAEIAAAATPEIGAAFEQAAPADQLFAGLSRYWRKKTDDALRG